jgi:hypothetical protein
MDLIDRYVHEVGRHLPRKNRSDIRAELHSSLTDALEGQAGGEPTEAQIVGLLREFGPPKKVAASYYPQGQYLIGPALYPLFWMVVGITLAAVVGAHLLAWGVALFVAHDQIAPLNALGGLLSAVPAAFGMVVLVFAILQRFEVRPEIEGEAWDPESLPHIREDQTVKRGGRVFGIVMGVVILVVLVAFPERIGFVTTPGGRFYLNPVIGSYALWITLSLLANITLDIYLLWQGRWSIATRIAKFATSLFSIGVLFLLVQGHGAWLAAHGAGSLISSLQGLAQDYEGGVQIAGMQAFRLAFAVALIVTIVDTLIMAYRMVRASLDGGFGVDRLPSRQA